jgi:hypothetical protein
MRLRLQERLIAIFKPALHLFPYFAFSALGKCLRLLLSRARTFSSDEPSFWRPTWVASASRAESLRRFAAESSSTLF